MTVVSKSAKGTTVLEIVEMGAPGRVVVVGARHIGTPLADQRRIPEGQARDCMRSDTKVNRRSGTHLPPPVGRNAGQKRKPVCSHENHPTCTPSKVRLYHTPLPAERAIP